jgi:hypothetical protein
MTEEIMLDTYPFRPWEICCIVTLLIYISASLSVITWINREKKLYDKSVNQSHGSSYSTDNGNSAEKEQELYELWLQIPPDQQKKHANGM